MALVFLILFYIILIIEHFKGQTIRVKDSYGILIVQKAWQSPPLH